MSRRFTVRGVTEPPAVADLKLWLDASAASTINSGSPVDGDQVSSWVDRSSNAATYSQATSTKQPLYKVNVANGRPGLLFSSAANQYLSETSKTIATSGTALTFDIVVKLSSFATAYKYALCFKNGQSFGLSNNASFKDIFFGSDTGTPQIWATNRWTTVTGMTDLHHFTVSYNGGTATTASNFSAKVDSVALTRTGTAGNDGMSENAVGSFKASTVHAFNGYILEVLAYQKVRSAAEDIQMANYIRYKYAR